MSDKPDLSKPYQNRTFQDYLDSGEAVPKTEDRESLRVTQGQYTLIQKLRQMHGSKSQVKVASLALYFGYHDLKYGFEFDWEAFDQWYADRLERTAEKYSFVAEKVTGIEYAHRPSVDWYVSVRVKDRHRPHLERMGRLFKVYDMEDVIRLCVSNALVCYDWETWLGEKWTGWLDWPYEARAQMENVFEDRATRIESADAD